MGPSSSKKKSFKYLLHAIDVFIKYAWFKPLKEKKVKTFFHGFVEIADITQINYGFIKEENFIILLCKKGLHNNILTYSTLNEGKSLVAERFIRTLKGKIYETITANNSKFYPSFFNKLVDKRNNTFPSSNGKKPIDAD